MSESIVARTRDGNKATCADCKSTVMVVEIDGERVQLDSEVISVVQFGVSKRDLARQPARQIHAETCLRHQKEAARRALAADRKARR